MLIIDPVANSADTSTITGLTGDYKWAGGVLAPNGKIVGIPMNTASVLMIDPESGTADTTLIASTEASAHRWCGGVLAPNGLIYGKPAPFAKP